MYVARGIFALAALGFLQWQACAPWEQQPGILATPRPDAAATPQPAASPSPNTFPGVARTVIRRGESVSWTNQDREAHTVTDESGEFDSGQIDPQANYGHVFTRAGTYTYRCALHADEAPRVVEVR